MADDLPRYLVYDGRAQYDLDAAMVLSCEDTLQEARDCHQDYGEIVVEDTETGTLEVVSPTGEVTLVMHDDESGDDGLDWFEKAMLEVEEQGG